MPQAVSVELFNCELKPSSASSFYTLDIWEKARPWLSDIVPILENLGFTVCEEVLLDAGDLDYPGKKSNKKVKSQKQLKSHKQAMQLTRFRLKSNISFSEKISISDLQYLFKSAFEKIIEKSIEQDDFNRLILTANIHWCDLKILRTYAAYLKQIHFGFEKSAMIQSFLIYPNLANLLVEYFKNKFNPDIQIRKLEKRESEILSHCQSVKALSDDVILRKFLELMKATCRTNYFMENFLKNPSAPLSIKLQPHFIQNMPEPVPLYEIFMDGLNFSGIHLRSAKIARGGIRWSDRSEDFRTEILGLMKAQKVKNAIIVPSGAKGGFVLKQTHFKSVDERQQAGIVVYEQFISNLLQLTDNILKQTVKRPAHLVCYDEVDTYLVVAADKGTATFSDRANAIAIQKDFWLGDAFASGGKNGYDHKKIGITARGAWESAKRHLSELNIDLAKTPVRMVGIGDMSGDVFGNGMLYSDQICLVAAFDHRHIFLDPNPDLKKSFAERKRLFSLPQSSWADYSAQLLSKGGGVFSRQDKKIILTPEIKKVLHIQEDQLTPSALVRAILMAPVDILFNGGIGTYIKGTSELSAQVGDKANDECRVNGQDVRARMVIEGGNLGATPAGRVEFALKGGFINADFIDNAAGVNCSDHEVNLKILFDVAIKANQLSVEQRNQTLKKCEKEITQLVLQDNIDQAWVLSSASHHAVRHFNLYHDYLNYLEKAGIVSRALDFLPSEKEMSDRKIHGLGLTRPELSVLLAYTKIYLKEAILESELVKDPDLQMYAEKAFPKQVMHLFQSSLKKHSLLPALIANEMSNQLINQMGLTYVYRLQIETGAEVSSIIKAQMVSAHIFSVQTLRESINQMGLSIDFSIQQDIFYQLRQLINLSTRWFLQNKRLSAPISQLIAHYRHGLAQIEEDIPVLMGGVTRAYLDDLVKKFLSLGLPAQVAKRIGTYRAVYTALNIIEISTDHAFDLKQTAALYFKVGEVFNLLWYRDELGKDTREGHWNVLSRLTLRDLLDQAQRQLSILILKFSGRSRQKPMQAIEAWRDQHVQLCERWDFLFQRVSSSASVDYSAFFVSVHELLKCLQA